MNTYTRIAMGDIISIVYIHRNVPSQYSYTKI